MNGCLDTPLRRGLILDRDGVINVDVNYLYRIEDCRFIDGIFELAHHFAARGFVLAVATNQAGIGRGYYGEGEVHILTERMLGELPRSRGEIARFYPWPDHPTARHLAGPP